MLNDGVTYVAQSDSTDPDCNAYISASPFNTLGLKELRVYLTDVSAVNSLYIGNLKVQVSDDGGSTWTDVYTFDDTVQQGWNWVDL